MVRVLIFSLLCSTGSAAVLFKVAAGPAGAGWSTDVPYVTGGSTQAVAGVSAPPYNYLRFASPNTPIRYSFPVQPGAYSVTLYLIEPRTGPTIGAGQRIFSVSVNGIVPFALKNIDIFAAVGSLKPWPYTFPVTSVGNSLTIAFSSTVGNAVVSGIQIDGPEPPRPVMYLRGVASARPACPGSVDMYGATDTHKMYWCDGVSWGPNENGLESDRPACPGAVDFYNATDTKRLYFCDGATWRLMGLASINLEKCTGSGATFNCAGLYRAAVPLADTTIFHVIGVPDTTGQTTGATWRPVN